jgi:hypothetical protein
LMDRIGRDRDADTAWLTPPYDVGRRRGWIMRPSMAGTLGVRGV